MSSRTATSCISALPTESRAMLQFEDFVVGESVRTRSIAVSQQDLVAFASRYDAQDFHVDPEAAKASFVGILIGSG